MKNLYILLIALFVFTYSNAQIAFQDHIVSTNADYATSVFPCDIDGDGDFDIVSSSAFDAKIAWYENTDGQGNFGTEQIITTDAHGAQSVYAVDLDGDGDMDVLSASFSATAGHKIAWYENLDGQGSFSALKLITNNADGTYSVFAADIDGDGDMDVLSASGNDNLIAWYENLDGQGDFGPLQTITTSAYWASSVYASDIDGDGDIDVLSSSRDDDKIAWYENTDGQGNFGPQQVITTSADYASSVCAFDIDNDGDIDVLSASPWDNKIAWYENLDGLGNFSSQLIISISLTNPTSIYVSDIDGDGDLDVLSASFTDDKISWFENLDGLGDFGIDHTIASGLNGVNTVYSEDLDNDGDMDILTSSQYDDKIAWNENLGFSPLIANQPNDLIRCDDNNDGIADFELSVVWPEIIGGQDSSDLVLTFHESQSDAENGINPLPYSYTNITNPQTIYARLENITYGVFDTTSFDLIVNNPPSPVTPTPLEVCDDDNDGFAPFNLTDKDEEIIGGEPDVIVTYHETQPDAELGLFSLTSPYWNIPTPLQTIFVRVFNPDTDCYTIVVLELHVLPTPEIIAITDYILLDENDDGIEIFDLTTKIPEILNGQSDIEVTFYESQEDAEDNINVIANPTDYTNITNPQAIYTRLENLESCFSVGSFVIFADPDLGITQNLFENLKIYPNPTKRMLNVKVNGLIMEEIAIINLQGMVLKNASNKNEIDVSGLATGIYFIQLSVEGKTITKKFIKE